MSEVHTLRAVLSDPVHAQAVIDLLDHYAGDPMGGNSGLSKYVRDNLITELQKRNNIFILLAFINNKPVGITTCIEGFSTFANKPLLNIHDMAVHRNYRGQGISQRLLVHAEDIAREMDCCKLTLEVLSGNEAARSAYKKFGFTNYQLDPKFGMAQFWEKPIIRP